MNYCRGNIHSKLNTICRCAMVLLVLFLSGCDDAKGTNRSYDGSAQCWQGHVLGAALKIIDTLFSQSSAKVANGGASVVLIAFSVWMALRLLKVLSSFKEESIGEVWTEISHKLFLCGFCAVGVASSSNISEMIGLFVVPVYNTVLELASAAVDIDPKPISMKQFGTVSYAGTTPTCKAVADISSLKNSILPMAQCLICNVNARLNSGIKIALYIMSSGNVAAMVIGLIVLFCFLCAKFGFVLFLIDSLFRVNFAVVLLPIGIICVPFAFTRKWALHAFLMFTNSSGVMFFMGLLVSIIVGTLQELMRHLGPSLDTGNTQGLGPVMMALLMISILLYNIPGLAVSLADKFFQGGGSADAMKKISKFVVTLAKKVGYAVLGSATQGATTELTDSVEKAEELYEAYDNMKQMKNKVTQKINEIAGRNE